MMCMLISAAVETFSLGFTPTAAEPAAEHAPVSCTTHTISSKTLWLSVPHGTAVHRVLRESWHCSTTFSPSETCFFLCFHSCHISICLWRTMHKNTHHPATWKIRATILFPSYSNLLDNGGRHCSLNIQMRLEDIGMLFSILWTWSVPASLRLHRPESVSYVAHTAHVSSLVIVIDMQIIFLLSGAGNMTYWSFYCLWQLWEVVFY